MKAVAILGIMITLVGCATRQVEVPVVLNGYRTGEMITPKECTKRSGEIMVSHADTHCSLS